MKSNDESPKPFGYAPESFHPERTVVATYNHTLVVCWDLKDSTAKVQAEGGIPQSCWKAQSDVIAPVQGALRGNLPDIVLPTGDGFIWIFNLERFGDPVAITQRRMLENARPIFDAIIWYQDHRAEARPLTDERGVTRYGPRPSGFDVTAHGSTMADGRFGVARGMVEVHECPAPRGPWVAPVGAPLFLAARLCAMAPDGGLLIDREAVADRTNGPAVASDRLWLTKETVTPKGWPEPVVVWRIAPRA